MATVRILMALYGIAESKVLIMFVTLRYMGCVIGLNTRWWEHDQYMKIIL